jgi:hypothetical protein
MLLFDEGDLEYRSQVYVCLIVVYGTYVLIVSCVDYRPRVPSGSRGQMGPSI